MVTGGGSGIGQGIALGLASAGAQVTIIGRRWEQLEITVSQAKKDGLKVFSLPGDISELTKLDDLTGKASDIYGPIDILVNCAGMNPRVHADEVDIKTWEATIRLNLTAPFFLAKSLIPGMKKRRYGRIINVGSLQSYRAFPNGIAYGASKAGVLQLTRAMSEAWSNHGITCNAVCPGFFKTSLTKSLFDSPEEVERIRKCTTIGREGIPEDLAGISIFLASPASEYITGQSIFVDGGWTAK